jgi:hypothetical protein
MLLSEICDRHDISIDSGLVAQSYIGGNFHADRILAPDGEPYLYRWHLVPRNRLANVYFHIQVRSDPERPLHDHPWDNTSTILVGGYVEQYQYGSMLGTETYTRNVGPGRIIRRNAEVAHRLILPKWVPYTMTLFTTGPHRREWGFWYPEGWVSNREVCQEEGNISIHVKRP